MKTHSRASSGTPACRCRQSSTALAIRSRSSFRPRGSTATRFQNSSTTLPTPRSPPSTRNRARNPLMRFLCRRARRSTLGSISSSTVLISPSRTPRSSAVQALNQTGVTPGSVRSLSFRRCIRVLLPMPHDASMPSANGVDRRDARMRRARSTVRLENPRGSASPVCG